MRGKIKISKTTIVRLAVFTALIFAAVLFDHYFENHPVELEKMEADTGRHSADHRVIYLFNSASSFSAKTPVFKNSSRKLFEQTHNKHLRHYHQLRNYQVLKADCEKPANPLIFSYHHLTFRHYYFTFPDDDPHIA
jgi:hypothetical protein